MVALMVLARVLAVEAGETLPAPRSVTAEPAAFLWPLGMPACRLLMTVDPASGHRLHGSCPEALQPAVNGDLRVAVEGATGPFAAEVWLIPPQASLATPWVAPVWAWPSIRLPRLPKHHVRIGDRCEVDALLEAEGTVVELHFSRCTPELEALLEPTLSARWFFEIDGERTARFRIPVGFVVEADERGKPRLVADRALPIKWRHPRPPARELTAQLKCAVRLTVGSDGVPTSVDAVGCGWLGGVFDSPPSVLLDANSQERVAAIRDLAERGRNVLIATLQAGVLDWRFNPLVHGTTAEVVTFLAY